MLQLSCLAVTANVNDPSAQRRRSCQTVHPRDDVLFVVMLSKQSQTLLEIGRRIDWALIKALGTFFKETVASRIIPVSPIPPQVAESTLYSRWESRLRSHRLAEAG